MNIELVWQYLPKIHFYSLNQLWISGLGQIKCLVRFVASLESQTKPDTEKGEMEERNRKPIW